MALGNITFMKNKMKNNMLSFRKVFLILGLLPVASVVSASPIVLNASHFSVTYDDSQTGLYGAASMSGSGDTVFFTPSQFQTASGLVSSTVKLNLSVDPGYVFSGLSYSEGGDYFLLGGASVNVTGSIDAKNTDTLALTSLVLTPGAPLDNVTSLFNFQTTNWSLAGDVSLTGLGAPTSLLLTLGNELFASPASSSGQGFIEKKFVGLKLLTVPASSNLAQASVPEPASWTLLLAGMMAAVWTRSRQREHGVKTGRRL